MVYYRSQLLRRWRQEGVFTGRLPSRNSGQHRNKNADLIDDVRASKHIYQTGVLMRDINTFLPFWEGFSVVNTKPDGDALQIDLTPRAKLDRLVLK